MEIKSTTEYSKFKTKKGNREILLSHASRLMRAIKQQNMLSANPIIVNEKMEVIDGQHRLKAAEILNIPIFYVEFNPASLAEIQLLNSNLKIWNIRDFLESYIKTGKKDYVQFKSYMEEYPLFPITMAMILCGTPDSLSRSREISQEFKDGLFKIVDMERAQQYGDLVEDVLKHSDRTTYSHTLFYLALFRMMKVDPNYVLKVSENLIKKGEVIHREISVINYLRRFEDILNYRNYGRVIRLMKEAE